MSTNKEPIIYYMRDNHTFKMLTGSVQEMIDMCLVEIYNHGYSHGSLFCRMNEKTVLSVHSYGVENLAELITLHGQSHQLT